MVYNTLYDSMSRLPASSGEKSPKDKQEQRDGVTALEQVIGEEPESQLLPVAESATMTSQGSKP